MTRTLLIDGDVIAYKAAASVQKTYRWDDGVHSIVADEKEAMGRVDVQIAALTAEAEADKIIVALTDKANFRKGVWPDYKSNRVNTDKPICLGEVRDYMVSTYDTRIRPTLEGDDILGILATHPRLVPGERIISSIDKDLKGIPGKHLIDGDVVEITEGQADLMFYMQVLSGDATDGYPGCPGIGPKKAQAILFGVAPEEEWLVGCPDHALVWAAIVAAYEKAKLTEGDALVQARCARILRSSDYDFKKKEVILWTPPSLS